ncbi:MAG: hypothetical protein KBA81_02640 [Rhabdochlamydiaceae bacterium]|nr:hypothetical protein [Rhabdochlamydiaceae bacterium]
MDKYSILLGYFDKQLVVMNRLYKESTGIDVSNYERRFMFAMKVQQFYTALEDLLKQIAKSFENHIDTMTNFHKELLIRMNTEIPKIRPAVISHQNYIFLDKLRAFRHFIRHAYDCELNENELLLIQKKLEEDYPSLQSELQSFRSFVQRLSNTL